MSDREDHFNLEFGWPPWDDEPSEAVSASIWRSALAATGAAIVLLSALLSALPFVMYQGKAPLTVAEWCNTAIPYIGLFFIGFGLFLVRLSR